MGENIKLVLGRGLGEGRGRAVWLGKVTKCVILSVENTKYTQEFETGVTEGRVI